MIRRHVTQNLGIRQGQLGRGNKNRKTSHPGNMKSALRPFSRSVGPGSVKMRRHTPSISPRIIVRIDWSRMSRKLALASLPRRAGSTRIHRTPIEHPVVRQLAGAPFLTAGRGAWPPPLVRRRPAASLLLGGSLLGGSLLRSGGSSLRRGGFLRGCLGHRHHLVVQRHTCLSPTGMNRPVPAPIHTKSFKLWKRNFTRNGLFFWR
jgi:hypothetical protein